MIDSVLLFFYSHPVVSSSLLSYFLRSSIIILHPFSYPFMLFIVVDSSFIDDLSIYLYCRSLIFIPQLYITLLNHISYSSIISVYYILYIFLHPIVHLFFILYFCTHWSSFIPPSSSCVPLSSFPLLVFWPLSSPLDHKRPFSI